MLVNFFAMLVLGILRTMVSSIILDFSFQVKLKAFTLITFRSNIHLEKVLGSGYFAVDGILPLETILP